ncbi:MAG TPA: SulP family inorganic anion transporter, partial [Crocinitomicaceae bacterium]|nr:SulP family inorganic anion transporter [Crocinitomicaceae bacterium]
QLPRALGYDGSLSFDKSFDFNAIVNSLTFGVIIITVVSLAILILWEKVGFLSKIKLLPGALVAVFVGIVLSELFKGSALEIAPSQFVVIAVPQTLAEYKNLIVFPDFAGFLNYEVWIIGATIAIVASIETLLCIEASDRIDPYKRITDTNVELKAQGVGNIVSSIIGGLPITSVIVRSSTNINAGATKKYSTIIHGFLLLLCVLAIPNILNKIPLGTLAAVLLIVGYKLASPAKLKHAWEKGKFQFVPFIATLVFVVTFDLLVGVIIGLIISILFLLFGNMKRAYYLSREELDNAQLVRIDLAEEVSFLNKAALKKTLKNIAPNSKVVINAKKSSYISGDIIELIEEFTNVRAKEEDIAVVLQGFKTNYEDDTNQPSRVVVKYRRTI